LKVTRGNGGIKVAIVKISQADRERLEQVQKYLYRNGAKDLDGLKDMCPKCGALMDGFRVEVEYLKCPSCGYEEKGLSLEGIGAFALGALVGIGIAALGYFLLGGREK
jgi:anaerobic ribonucleoside-triphosphate reductase